MTASLFSAGFIVLAEMGDKTQLLAMAFAMLLSGGDPLVFIQRPISTTLLAVAAALLVVLIFPAIRKKREEALQE